LPGRVNEVVSEVRTDVVITIYIFWR